MSFAGTPLGQGRRLDHSAFHHGNPASTGAAAAASYSYGAPALGSRSPPKAPSSPFGLHPGVQHDKEHDIEQRTEDGALSRFARLKQQEQQQKPLSNRPGGPKVFTSPPKPERWSVKDTTVNIATAFTQAASSSTSLSYDMSTTSSTYNNNNNNNNNNSWASSSRNPLHVPRSTSVEYEAAAAAGSAATQPASKRALPAPPDKFSRPTGPITRKPPSKASSLRHVPDSEGEEDQSNNPRGMSPFEHSLSFAKHALGAAAYYVRHRSRDPEEQRSVNGNNGNRNNDSYDYAAEEQVYQSQKRAAGTTTSTPPSSTAAAAHRKNRMSMDNKAYKPSQESEDEEAGDDDVWSDGAKRRKKRALKGTVGGPLSTLPVVKADKRRRRKKGTLNSLVDGEGGESGSEEADNNIQPNQIPSSSRRSQEPTQDSIDDISAEQGLTSIPEVDEEHLLSSTSAAVSQQKQQQQHKPRSGSMRPRSRSRSRTPAPPPSPGFSIGGILGQIVHLSIQLFLWAGSGLLACLSTFTFLFGQVFGTAYDLVLRRPIGWAASGGGRLIGKYTFPALVLILAGYVIKEASLGGYVPLFAGPKKPYSAPDVLPADISELVARLLKVENALYGISADAERTRSGSEKTAKDYREMQSRLGALEGRVGSEVRKVQEAVEGKAREFVRGEVGGVKKDVEMLLAQAGTDRRERDRREEKLRQFEDRLGGFEGGFRDALEQIAKKPAATTTTTVVTTTTSVPSAAWWNKVASKSGDAQDVNPVISQLVHSAILTYTKDNLAKPDFAHHSGGGRVIPSLTSRTLDQRPKTFRSKLYSLFTGTGYSIGRSPVTALHHELHNGHCWPFPGQQGQLGVILARDAVTIDEFTVDHISTDVAFDLSSAPKDMEVWGMVEGAENIEKLKQRIVQESEQDEQHPDSIPYPSTLPKSPQFIRLANFTYDIDDPNHIQTFPVHPEIKALGLDFGIVVLRVLNNWGMDQYTCLYRFRVHGKLAKRSITLPHGDARPEDSAVEQEVVEGQDGQVS